VTDSVLWSNVGLIQQDTPMSRFVQHYF